MGYHVKEYCKMNCKIASNQLEVISKVEFVSDAVSTAVLLAQKHKVHSKEGAAASVPSPNTKFKYIVLLQQTALIDNQVLTYKIFSSRCVVKTYESFEAAQLILEVIYPVPLSLKLLEALFIPTAKAVDNELPLSLVKYIKINNGDLLDLELKRLATIESIVQQAFIIRDAELIKLLIVNGANSNISDPETQNNLLHFAVQQPFEYFKVILEYMEESLSSDVFMMRINQTNIDTIYSNFPAASGNLTRSSNFSSTSNLSSTIANTETSMSRMTLPATSGKIRRSSNFSSTSNLSSTNRISMTLSATSGKLRRSFIFSSTSNLSFTNTGIGMTPLMIACQEDKVPSAHCLLVVGADPNIPNAFGGTTALHIAANTANPHMIKLLLAFEADMDAADNEGATPLDIIKISQKPQAKECLLIMHKVKSLRSVVRINSKSLSGSSLGDKEDKSSINETFSINSLSDDEAEDVVHLLSLDGGGTKAYTGCFMLYRIERKMQLISGDPNLQIINYFNWAAGTSVGSLVILILSQKWIKCQTREALKIISFHKNEIFGGKRIYDPEQLVRVCKKYAQDKKINSITDLHILMTTVVADISPPNLVHITNYREDPGNGREWKVWEAARASSAAPTYFPSFEGKYVDGGILAPNPVLHAISDIHCYDNRKLKFVLSLGTGISPPQPIENIDFFMPKLSKDFISDLKADYSYISGLLNMLTAGVSDVKTPSTHAQEWCKSIGAVYHRISTPLSKVLDLDTTDDNDIVSMIYDGYIYCLEHDHQLHDIAMHLLKQGPLR